MWALDDPQYLSIERKYMYFKEPIKDNGLNNQWLALKSALAIAKILGRHVRACGSY